MKILFVASLCSLFPVSATAFAFVQTHPTPSSALFVEKDTWFRAVEVAQGKKSAPIDEIDKLATELEEFIGCKYEEESSEEICDKEIQDRIDVAEILRLKIELGLRLDYLNNANLFADDVIKEHNAEERKKFKEALMENREKVEYGSDLGLW